MFLGHIEFVNLLLLFNPLSCFLFAQELLLKFSFDRLRELSRQVFLPGRQALIVRLNAQAGKRAALLDLLNTYADGLAEEPGTEMYMVSVDPDDDDLVWLYETCHS